MDYEGTYTGRLSSAQAQDTMQVSLTIEGGSLHAREADGATWHIPLERVGLLRWSDRALRLELAGAEIDFIPDQPDPVLSELVPALLARRSEAVPAPTGAASAPPTPPPTDAPAGLVVDLTDPEPPTPAPVAPAPWPSQPAAPPAPFDTRRPRRRRVLAWALVALVSLAAAAGVLILVLGGSDSNPEDSVREALDAAGLSTVAVDVTGGTATLSGTVGTPEELEAAEAVASDVAGIDAVTNGIEVAETEPTPPTTLPAGGDPLPTLAEDAAAALIAAGIDSAAIQAEGDLVVVSGTVASEADRRAALAALFGIDGVVQVDNRLTVASVPDETVTAQARAALDQAGFETVAISVDEGVATLTGVVPLEVLESGFFRYSNRAEAIVIEQEGVQGLRNRLQLTGDAATLRDQLRSLTEAAPITFGLGGSSLNAAGRTTLDTASDIIQAQPGLRILIAGHTDTTGSAAFNEQLSQERAEAVRRYLIDRGIAANRLVVVAYGELFPSTPGAAPLDRRVEFEVAG